MYRGKKHQEDVLLEYLEEEEASCTLYPHSPESTETRGGNSKLFSQSLMSVTAPIVFGLYMLHLLCCRTCTGDGHLHQQRRQMLKFVVLLL